MSNKRRCAVLGVSLILFASAWLVSAPYRATANEEEDRLDSNKLVGEVHFDRTPLGKVFATLTDKTGVGIDVDWESLAALKLNRETPVTLHIFHGSLNLAMRLVMESIAPSDTDNGTPDFWLEGKTIKVEMTIHSSPLVVRAYPIDDLLQLPDGWIPQPPPSPKAISGIDNRDERAKQVDRLIWTIESSIRDSWDQGAGLPGMHEYGGELLVTAMQDKQRKVADFLRNIRRLRTARENNHPTTRGVDAFPH